MSAVKSSKGILAEQAREQRERIVQMLTRAYWMEVETVISYLANSVNPDGVRAGDRGLNDMVIAILHDEEGHRRLFEGFLREYQQA